jgi:hypothetical protein
MFAVARGCDPAAEKKKAKRGPGTFAELVQQHGSIHNKSWRQADALIRRHVLPYWSKLQTTTVTGAEVKQMMRRIEASIAANQTLAAVSAVYRVRFNCCRNISPCCSRI